MPRLKALGLRLEEPLKGIGLKAAILVLSDIGLGSKSRIRPMNVSTDIKGPRPKA